MWRSQDIPQRKPQHTACRTEKRIAARRFARDPAGVAGRERPVAVQSSKLIAARCRDARFSRFDEGAHS